MKQVDSLFYVLFVVIAGMFITSCSEDESYDFPGDADNKVYIKAGGRTGFTITHTLVSDVTDFELNLLAGCRMIPSTTIGVDVAIDTALVSSYNAAHGTAYHAIPAENFVFSGTEIAPDTMRAKDPIVVTLKEDKLKGLTSKEGYLVPVKIASVTGDALPSTNLNVVYAVIAVESDNDNIDDKGTVSGERNTDRAGWTVFTSLNTTPDADSEKAFDDDVNSSWSKSDSKSFDVVIDMGKSYNVSGLYAKYRQYGYYDRPVITSGTEIFVSEDNSTWKSMGKVQKDDQIIAFYAPVAMRYVKWTVPESTDWYGEVFHKVEISDFNIYVK